MPNRFIKESICTSESIDSLTPFQEITFYRLIVNCDDFGRFDARPKVLSARLFPLRNVSVEEIQNALDAFIREDMIVIYEVDGKSYIQVKSWSRHQQTRATKSKYPAPPDTSSSHSDSNGNQVISDDIGCARNRIRNTLFDNRNSESESDNAHAMISDEEAAKIQGDHDRVLDAAEDAGFKMSNAVRAKIINMLGDHSVDQMLNAINECVTHGALSLAYLEAVLKGGPKKKNTDAKDIHGYGQRDYSGEQEKAIERMLDPTFWPDATKERFGVTG